MSLAAENSAFPKYSKPSASAGTRASPVKDRNRLRNRHVKDGIGKAEFIAIRNGRDATLPLPGRMLAALQVNIRGGRLPEAEADGHSYLRIPEICAEVGDA